ncbi:hypothetical protein M408DRAFT_64116 [Serendipita vermifera MAFF 305830]|uniref:Uncharacterized protein n=1 Tax=Serendipita vermifera MAFF 305830 TaxID=933852 RepID=A0A0C3BI21_SERVB|nr:hypothetical protein M408DRAFT_64116 [Serendipita vermifera MAFF 305830]
MSSRGSQSLQNISQSLPNGPAPSSSLASLVSPLNSRHSLLLGSNSNAIHTSSVSANAQAAPDAIINGDMPVKRGPGRPKGSTNKNKPPQLGPDGNPIPKRPVGRPRKEVDPNAPVKPKNPVGRPRKHPLPPDSDNQTANVRSTQSSTSSNAAGNALSAPFTGQHQLNAPSGSSSARLAPSPTLASCHPWGGTNGSTTPSTMEHSANQMNTGYRQMPNGHIPHGHVHNQQVPRPQQTPSTLPPSSASSSAHFQSPQINVYDALSLDTDLISMGGSPLLHSSQHPPGASASSSLGRQPPSPAIASAMAHSQNHRHLGSSTPHLPGSKQTSNRSPNWEVLEAAIWKEIQALNFVNPRVVVENAKTRSLDVSALRRIVPEDVFMAYTDHLRELRRETPAGCPDAYTILNSFWLPGIAPFFHLTTSRSSASTPPSNYRFFYWDPMYLLVGGIPCPHCSSGLVRDGFHGPCPVIDLGDPFYLIGQAYKCAHCSRRQEGPAGGLYLSWDEGILKSLPDPLAKEFPAYNTSWGSFSNALRDLVRALAKEGMDAKHAAGAIRAVCKPGGSAALERSSARDDALDAAVTAPASPEVCLFDLFLWSSTPPKSVL